MPVRITGPDRILQGRVSDCAMHLELLSCGTEFNSSQYLDQGGVRWNDRGRGRFRRRLARRQMGSGQGDVGADAFTGPARGS